MIATLPWNVATFDGRFEGFAGRFGLFTSTRPPSPDERTTLTAHAWV